MENGLSNSSKRSLKISLRSPKRNLKKTLPLCIILMNARAIVLLWKTMLHLLRGVLKTLESWHRKRIRRTVNWFGNEDFPDALCVVWLDLLHLIVPVLIFIFCPKRTVGRPVCKAFVVDLGYIALLNRPRAMKEAAFLFVMSALRYGNLFKMAPWHPFLLNER